MSSIRLPLTLLVLLALQLSVWQWGLSYEHLLTLSGYLSINFMSLTMLLAMRPRWLESPLGGLDKMYQLHKWTGILGALFAIAHWLTEETDDAVKSLFGKERSLREADFSGLLDSLQDSFKDLGEQGFYLLVALVTITLLRRVPYRFWRYLHRAMPVIYLVLAAHAVLLAPLQWWQQPIGALMLLFMLGGVAASVRSVSGSIGKHHRWQGVVQSVQQMSHTTTEVLCAMGDNWPGHKAGQFALVTFDKAEGAHPFTLASADQHNGLLSFQIKALGDYTRRLPQKLQAGQPVTVEGPYGCFNPDKGRSKAQQIWVAGGIGITPFLAALDARLHQDQAATPVTLYYCTSGAADDTNLTRVKQLMAQLPDSELKVYDSSQGERLSADQLQIRSAKADIWFCGPQGLADSLHQPIKTLPSSVRFHQERFEFR